MNNDKGVMAVPESEPEPRAIFIRSADGKHVLCGICWNAMSMKREANLRVKLSDGTLAHKRCAEDEGLRALNDLLGYNQGARSREGLQRAAVAIGHITTKFTVEHRSGFDCTCGYREPAVHTNSKCQTLRREHLANAVNPPDRPDHAHVTPPWPHVDIKTAARELGVAPGLVVNLCRDGLMESVQSASEDGLTTEWLVSKEAVAIWKQNLT